jgi:hypothetical protein
MRPEFRLLRLMSFNACQQLFFQQNLELPELLDVFVETVEEFDKSVVFLTKHVEALLGRDTFSILHVVFCESKYGFDDGALRNLDIRIFTNAPAGLIFCAVLLQHNVRHWTKADKGGIWTGLVCLLLTQSGRRDQS